MLRQIEWRCVASEVGIERPGSSLRCEGAGVDD